MYARAKSSDGHYSRERGECASYGLFSPAPADGSALHGILSKVRLNILVPSTPGMVFHREVHVACI